MTQAYMFGQAPQTLPFKEWQARYTKMRDIADRIARYRNTRAREACKLAGLDPSLLGIHPHNAMISFEQGKPWPGVDYSQVRRCLRELRHEFDASRIVDAWSKRTSIA